MLFFAIQSCYFCLFQTKIENYFNFCFFISNKVVILHHQTTKNKQKDKMETHVIEFVVKENLDTFVQQTKAEKLKSQLDELDFKYQTGQRIPQSQSDILAREEREMNERLEQKKWLHDNFSQAAIKATDESNYAYFE